MSGNESRYEKLHIVKKPNAISRSQRGSETSTHWFAGNFDEPFDWSIFSRSTALVLDAFQPVTSDIDILVISQNTLSPTMIMQLEMTHSLLEESNFPLARQ